MPISDMGLFAAGRGSARADFHDPYAITGHTTYSGPTNTSQKHPQSVCRWVLHHALLLSVCMMLLWL